MKRFYIIDSIENAVVYKGELSRNVYMIVDGTPFKRIAAVSMWDYANHDRLKQVCARLNAREIARNRQFGEPRREFAKRRIESGKAYFI